MDLKFRRATNTNKQIHAKRYYNRQGLIMIDVLNNLPDEHDVIIDGLENCLIASGESVLTINVICKKFNHWHKN